MLSDAYIEIQKRNLSDLGDRLNKEALFAKQLIDSNNRPINEINWFSSVRTISIYSTFVIKNLIDTLDNYKNFSEEQISFYIGKIAIQPFLEIINAFEQSLNELIRQNETIKQILNERIDKKIKSIEESWKPEVNNQLKNELIKGYKRKLYEMKFIRDSLRKNQIIDKLDLKILEFAWDIRNSMHSNFLAIKDIKFSAPESSLNYSFQFKKRRGTVSSK